MTNQTKIRFLFGFLIGWSVLIALGSILFDQSLDYRKPLIVLGSMGIFLIVWAWALRTRHHR